MRVKPKPLTISNADPLVRKVYNAAHMGDTATLEQLREHVRPDLWVVNTTPRMCNEPTSLIDAALFVYVDGEIKDEAMLARSDDTALWLLQRADELGLLGSTVKSLTTALSSEWNLVDRALLILCPKTAVFLTERGAEPYAVGKGEFSRAPTGDLVEASVVPNKNELIERLERALVSARLAGKARHILAELRGDDPSQRTEREREALRIG